jgi:hypothetical protein
MATKRKQILQAVKTKLVSLPGVADADVYRSRDTAFSRAKTPAVVIEWVSDTPNVEALGIVTWSLLVSIRVIARGEIPDDVADPIVQDIHTKLTADLSLGGLSMDIQPATVQNDISEADLNLGVISCGYRITYRTSETSIS